MVCSRASVSGRLRFQDATARLKQAYLNDARLGRSSLRVTSACGSRFDLLAGWSRISPCRCLSWAPARIQWTKSPQSPFTLSFFVVLKHSTGSLIAVKLNCSRQQTETTVVSPDTARRRGAVVHHRTQRNYPYGAGFKPYRQLIHRLPNHSCSRPPSHRVPIS